MDINFNHLHNFYVIAKSGSLKAAALNLRISQSTLSEQMKSMETAMNKKLLSRVGRSLNLTQEGRDLLAKVGDLFDKTTELLQNKDTHLKYNSEIVEIGITTSISRSLIFQVLKPIFQKTGSLIRITESTGDTLLMSFKKQDIDIFITHEKLSKSLVKNLKSISLRKPRLLLVGSSAFEHLLDKSAKELSEQPFFLFTVRSQLRWETEKFFKSNNINPLVKAEVDDPELIKAAVVNDLGIAVLPEHAIQRELKEKKLIVLSLLPPSDLSIYAYYVEREPTDEFTSVLNALMSGK